MPATPQHIGMIVPSFDRVGGYEKQAYSMCLAYREAGKTPLIITENLGGLPTYEVREEIEIYRFYPFSQRFTGGFGLHLRKLFAFDLAKRIDILHCHAFDFLSGWAIEAAQPYGIPSLVKIATERDVLQFEQHLQAKTRGFAEGWQNLSQATRFISLNPNIRKELIRLGVAPEKILMLPNGVDAQRFQPLPALEKMKLKERLGLGSKPFLLTYAGRFEERKCVTDLLTAWSLLAEKFPEHHLVLVGEGEEREACQKQVLTAGLSGRVSFVGEVSNVDEYLKASDFFVFPSRLEGMPNVILEAMACGLPILTTSIPGIVELITHERNGLLVPPQNPNAFAEMLQTLLSHPEQAPKLGKSAREAILQNYAFPVLSQRYFEIYQELLRTPGVASKPMNSAPMLTTASSSKKNYSRKR